jgi:uncharacterized protein YjbJ (UPF0337 family)
LQPPAGNEDDALGEKPHDRSGAGSVLDHHHDDQPLHVQPGAVTAVFSRQSKPAARVFARYAGLAGNTNRRSEFAIMDKDRIAGTAKEIKGSLKETIGKAVGDAKLQSDGKADQLEGKVQNALGGLKDALKK